MICRLYFLLFTIGVISQSLVGQDVLEGVILDTDTDLPLPFVNIGFIDRGIGTVSDEDGFFHLSYDVGRLSFNDTLQISSLAYKTRKIPYNRLNAYTSAPKEIKLEPEVMDLDEIVLSNKRTRLPRNNKPRLEGYSFVSRTKRGSWEGEGALGGELVTKIRLNKKKRQLNAFFFHVLENASDSLLVRVNVYRGDTFFPEKKLTDQNIFYILKTKIGKVGIDLSPYNLTVNDDFSIGIELLKVYGDKVGLVLAADDTPGVSYRRYTSQGIWKRYLEDALTYYVSTTVIDEDEIDGEEHLFTEYTNEKLIQVLGKNMDQVSGLVLNNGEPITAADVINMTTGEGTTTDEKGRYSLNANVNDELKFSYLGMQEEVRKVLETTFAINVSMQVKVEQLENVNVSSRQPNFKTQTELFEAYNSNTNIIKSAFGLLNKKTAGYTLNIVDEADLPKSALNILEAIQGKFSGVRISPKGQPRLLTSTQDPRATIYLRAAYGSILYAKPAIYEVDGTVYTDPPLFLNVTDIKRIAKIPGHSGTIKYGSIAVGGIFVINTKTGNFSPTENKATKKVNKLGEGGTIISISQEQARRNWPNFLQELYTASSPEDAIAVYDSYSENYGTHPNFNIDASNYFMEFWPDDTFTKGLIDDNLNRFEKNATYLKALAFVLDKYGKSNQSLELYKKVLVLRSNVAQSYRDLANAYVANNLEEKGANLYARYFNMVKEGFFSNPPEPLRQVINTEVKNLLKTKDRNDPSVLVQDKSGKTENGSTRILLEWNDDTTDMTFQFVSPEKNVSEWSTSENMGKANVEYSKKMFTSKDFFIYDSNGNWQANVNYKGNKSGLATYLKITISYDYGTPRQNTDIKIFRLGVKNVNRELLKIENPVRY